MNGAGKSGAVEASRSEATKRWFEAPSFTAITFFSSGRVTVICNHNHACVADVAGKNATFKTIVHLEPLQGLLAGGLA